MTARLAVHDLTLGYDGRDVLRGVSFELQSGQLVGLIGPNGSGKTSLLRAIVGARAPNAGAIAIDGLPIAPDPAAYRARLGYSVDPDLLPARLTGRQCVDIVARLRPHPNGAASTQALAAILGMEPWFDRPVSTYSLGTRQKLAILVALYGDPPLLVLDEILNGLDPLAAYELKEELKRRAAAGTTVLLATHGLEVAERFLDRALLLLDGRIAADWNAADLAAFRADPDGGLEHAVMERLRARSTAR
jgi:ABC-2 type transport system ATP-binding protein